MDCSITPSCVPRHTVPSAEPVFGQIHGKVQPSWETDWWERDRLVRDCWETETGLLVSAECDTPPPPPRTPPQTAWRQRGEHSTDSACV